MTKDRYSAQLGGIVVQTAAADVAALVMRVWPGSWQEGSTGPERTWYVRDVGPERLIAHTWPADRSFSRWWIRLNIERGWA